jgi:hypothetical protein
VTGNHIIYIPVMLMVGFVIGWILGRKALQSELVIRKEKIRRRKQRRAAAAEQESAEPSATP